MTLPADLRAMQRDLDPALQRAVARMRRRRAVAAASVVIAAVGASAAYAGIVLLGKPAPKVVQAQVSNMVRSVFISQPGLKSQTARVLAEAPHATLYGVSSEQGDYCVELVGTSRGVIFAFGCYATAESAAGAGTQAGLQITQFAPTVVKGASPPVVQFGRIPVNATSARAVFQNGASESIRIGLHRFFVYEPSATQQATAERMPMTIKFLGRGGRTVGSTFLQPPQAITTTGNRPDRISGKTLVQGASKVEILVASKTSRPSAVRVPITPDGTFDWSAPAGAEPLTVILVDATNKPLTTEEQPMSEPFWTNVLQGKAPPQR